MKTRALGDLCAIRSGGTPSRSNSEFYGGEIPWAKISDIEASNGVLIETEETITPKGLAAIRGRTFRPGTLLFAIYGSIGKMAFAGQELSTNQAILGIENSAPNELCARYLYRYLESRRDALLSDGSGIAQKNLSAGYIRDLKIPLPQLAEQKRIAAILDHADELRRKRNQALDRLNQLGQAIFYEMFGDPLGIPSDKLEWTTEPLEKNVEFMDYRGKTPLKAETGIRLITARNVKMGFITLEPQEFVEEDSYDTWMTRGFPEIGDVLFTTEAPLGHVAQLAISEKVVIGQRLITMKPNRFVIRPTYLEFFLRTPSFRTLMFKNSTGSTVVGIKSKLLKKIAIRYPSGLEQDRFEEAIQQLRSTKPKLENAFEQTNNIFLSLQHRAFRGEL
ncbi:MAG: restriction endonuclease subunit S [Roseomonas sp.]|nr:restriction endonuclease subunit S [Roseomonas sp.]